MQQFNARAKISTVHINQQKNSEYRNGEMKSRIVVGDGKLYQLIIIFFVVKLVLVSNDSKTHQ